MRLQLIYKIFLLLIAGGFSAACAGISPRDRTDDIADSISYGAANITIAGAWRSPIGLFYITGNRTRIDSNLDERLKKGRVKPQPGQIAQHAEESAISVTIYSEPDVAAEAQEVATIAARILAAGTEKLWPKESAAVHLTLVAYDPGAGKFRSPIRLKHKAAPWKLEFYTDPDLLLDASAKFAGEPDYRSRPGAIAAHEFYHLIARHRRIGVASRKSALHKRTRRVLEEAAAMGYGYCAQLLAGEVADARGMPGFTMSVTRQEGEAKDVEAPFPDSIIEKLVSYFEQSNDVNYVLHMGINPTIWMDISGGSFLIKPETPEADRLLAFCEMTASNPDRVLDWLKDIAADGVDAPGPVPRHRGAASE